MKIVLITYILSYIVIILSGFIYNLLGYNDINFFTNNIAVYILLIYYLITIIYLYKKNPQKEKNLNFPHHFFLISSGISLATIYNMIIFKLTSPSPTTTTMPLLLLLISSGIIGPIFEEIIFRYMFYNKLKRKYTIKKSILINSLVFALIHIHPLKIFYAFILSIIINLYYEKYQTIKAPILIHISANIIVLFLTEYNILILLLAITNFLLALILTSFSNKTM